MAWTKSHPEGSTLETYPSGTVCNDPLGHPPASIRYPFSPPKKNPFNSKKPSPEIWETKKKIHPQVAKQTTFNWISADSSQGISTWFPHDFQTTEKRSRNGPPGCAPWVLGTGYSQQRRPRTCAWPVANGTLRRPESRPCENPCCSRVHQKSGKASGKLLHIYREGLSVHLTLPQGGTHHRRLRNYQHFQGSTLISLPTERGPKRVTLYE